MRHLSAPMSAKTTLWMCVALAAAILAAFLMVVLGTPTKRAEAAFPGKNGKIAFVSGSEIVTMNANGDNKSKLTNNDPHVYDIDPVFSANGRKIAFASERSGNGDIYTMSANGTDLKRVTTDESREGDPSWSPDGTRIAFSSDRTGKRDIYVINQNGSGLTRLTTSPKPDSQPAWSPDGTKIAFVRDFKIYVMKAAPESETNIPQRLTPRVGVVAEHDPAWSPNGNRIAFAGIRAASAIYAIRADGSGLIKLTKPPGFAPAWSPDGTKIAFDNCKIYVMKAAPESETNRRKRLTGNNGCSGVEPDWQPLR